MVEFYILFQERDLLKLWEALIIWPPKSLNETMDPKSMCGVRE